jgi:Tol biopolymer transport system component
MGEVYRARDPRLKRDVAIKVLARAGTDPLRQRRLLDEAQAASALNHPNIVTVYDVGTHEGTPFIVSELVEGVSVRDMLARAPLPVRDLLDLGVQMAEGLAAAHQAGIVHRDFKPENVMVTRDGRVKILDFGLALVGLRDGGPTAEAEMTLTASGIIVGTVPYMSPEQARGAMVDYRTDQFSLGLTLYEMATSRRAFSAETAAQILAAILDDEPEPIAKVNPKVPAPVQWVIERCLHKDARQRYDATADLARELRTLRDRLAEFAPPTDVALEVPRRRGRAMLAMAGLGAIAAVAVIGGLARATRDADNIGLDQYRWTPFATDAGYQASPAWSPDGKTLAYVADVDGVLQVFAKSVGSSMRQQVTHMRFHCRDPFWSPDGTRLFYVSLARDREGLWSTSASGGEPEFVMEDVYRAALSPDGKTLAFFRGRADSNMQLWLSSPSGSKPAPYTRPPFASRHYVRATVHFSPDGSKLGVWVEHAAEESNLLRAEFWVVPLGEAAPYVVPTPVANLAGLAPAFSWLPDSRRVLSALPDPKPGMHLWLTDTERAAPRLITTSGGQENDPAVSPEGTRVALTFQQADYDLYQLSIEHPSPVAMLATSRNEMDPALSPSGTVMAFTTDRTGREEIWLRSEKGNFDRPLVTPADFGVSQTYLLSAPAFSADGERIAYSRAGSEGYRIWISPVAGGPPVQLTPGAALPQDSPSWSPDRAWVAFAQSVNLLEGGWSLAKMRVGARTPFDVVVSDIVPFSPVQWSPDGSWIAYNGQSGLSVVSPDGQSTRVLHEEPWMAFAWSEDSRRLYGIRPSDDLQHLTFTSVDIRSRAEHVLGPDFMPLPVSGTPVRGFTRVSSTTFLTSIVRVRSDVWLLEGFQPSPTLWDRLVSVVSFQNR